MTKTIEFTASFIITDDKKGQAFYDRLVRSASAREPIFRDGVIVMAVCLNNKSDILADELGIKRYDDEGQENPLLRN